MQIDRTEAGGASLLEELLGAPAEGEGGASFEGFLEELLRAAGELELPPEGTPLPPETTLPPEASGSEAASDAATSGGDLALLGALAATESEAAEAATDVAGRLQMAQIDARSANLPTRGPDAPAPPSAAERMASARGAALEAPQPPVDTARAAEALSPDGLQNGAGTARPEVTAAATAVADRGARTLLEGVHRARVGGAAEANAARVAAADGPDALPAPEPASVGAAPREPATPDAARTAVLPRADVAPGASAPQPANERDGAADARLADARAEVTERAVPESFNAPDAVRPVTAPVTGAPANITPPVAVAVPEVTPDLRGPAAPAAPQPIEALPQHIELLTTQGGGIARVRLHPAELGEVEITVRLRGGNVEVVIHAEEPAARMAVLANREQLVEAMGSRDLRVDSFEVAGRRDEDATTNDGSPQEAFDRAFDDERRGAGDGRREAGVSAGVQDAVARGVTAAALQPEAGIDIRI